MDAFSVFRKSGSPSSAVTAEEPRLSQSHLGLTLAIYPLPPNSLSCLLQSEDNGVDYKRDAPSRGEFTLYVQSVKLVHTKDR